jgi:hypothetical protein
MGFISTYCFYLDNAHQRLCGNRTGVFFCQQKRRSILEADAHYLAAGIWSCPPIIDDINRRLKNGETPLPEWK